MGKAQLLVAAALFVPHLLASPLDAQDGRTEEDERARGIARADSIRESRVQPPGDRDGLTAMDAIRAPFQVVGGVLALALAGGGVAWEILDRTRIVDGALAARDALAEVGVEVEPDFIGSRSWPALVFTYRGLDPFYARAGYSLRHYELYSAGVELGNERRGFEASSTFRNLRELHFWGVGADSRAEDRSDYAHEQWEMGAWGWADLRGPFGVGLGAAWEENVVGPGFEEARSDVQETFDPAGLFGSDEPARFLRYDAEVDVDFTRVVELQPRGVRLLAEYQVFRGQGGTDAGFHRASADLRGYIPVTRRQSLALRVLAEDHLSESGRGVPFTHLAELGDDDGLRGHSSRRFRDRALAAATAEWRYEVWWHPGAVELRVEGFLFADHGTVGPSLGALDGGDFRTTPGLGVRVTDTGEAELETFVAFGGEGARFDISLGGTF